MLSKTTEKVVQLGYLYSIPVVYVPSNGAGHNLNLWRTVVKKPETTILDNRVGEYFACGPIMVTSLWSRLFDLWWTVILSINNSSRMHGDKITES